MAVLLIAEINDGALAMDATATATPWPWHNEPR